MKRKRSTSREAIQFRTGEPLSYGSRFTGPGRRNRVPRSVQSSLMSGRRPGITLSVRLLNRPPAKRVLQLQVPRQRVVRATPRSSKVGAFRFRSPFALQYRKMVALGQMVRRPERVLFCLKRKVRREVLFAFRRAGYRGSGPGRRRTYRRNGNSLHGC